MKKKKISDWEALTPVRRHFYIYTLLVLSAIAAHTVKSFFE